jgi:hypothetical protein
VDKALDILRANAVEQRALQEKAHEQNEALLQRHKQSEEQGYAFGKFGKRLEFSGTPVSFSSAWSAIAPMPKQPVADE